MSAMDRTVQRACPGCGKQILYAYDEHGASQRRELTGGVHVCDSPRDRHVGGRALDTK